MTCTHRYPDGRNAWYLVKKLNGYSYYRCGICGENRTIRTG
jgi:hypothetical protein